MQSQKRGKSVVEPPKYHTTGDFIMPRKPGIPAYRLHAASGQARVIIDGKHLYLGKYGTEESKAQYDRLVRKLLGERTSEELQDRVQTRTELTLYELMARYLRFARSYYTKHGRITPEYAQIYSALDPVLKRHGNELVTGFGPLKLKAIRDEWVKAGLVRGQINKRVGRVRRAIGWGVEEELVPGGVFHALKAIAPLKAGRTDAPEGKKVLPVREEFVDAIGPYVNRQIWTMVTVQRLTGARPTEVCVLRAIDIKTSGRIWEYTPIENKMEHHQRQRVVFIGPQAQRVLAPWLKTHLEGFLFSPKEAVRERRAEARAKRKTRVQPSQQDRSKLHPRRPPGDRYTYRSYARAIAKACEAADVPHWHPNQLRHLVGTKIRRELGLESSQVVLGHARADVTQVYAERDAALARAAMERLG
jgi:integrase